MKRYLLDTNIWIALSKSDRAAHERISEIPAEQIFVSAITRGELSYGAWKSNRVTESLEAMEYLIGNCVSLSFDDAAADRYGILRAHLQQAGTPIGGNDLLIAAIALANDCILVTRNVREFRRVPGLSVEAWT